MWALTQSLHGRLSDDATLAAMLADSVINAAEPAVYTMPVPPDAEMPYVVIAGAGSDSPRDTFDGEYRDLVRDIHVYAARPDHGGGSTRTVDEAAERCRALLHRQPLTVTGWRNLVAEVSGPIVHDGERAFGRVLQCRLLLGAAPAGS